MLLMKSKRYKEAADTMKIFLLNTLPTTLWKYELDKPLNTIEQALVYEVIPFARNHHIWEDIEHIVREDVNHLYTKHCRRCGKFDEKNGKFCGNCKAVWYCSLKCQREDMEDKIFGHYKIECKLL